MDTFGPFLLAMYCLATARWGSYLIPGPPYVCDLILLGLLGNRLLLIASKRQEKTARDSIVVLIAACMIIWVLARDAFGPLNVDAARDAAPYLYVILAFLIVPLRPEQSRFAAKAVTAALVFHLAWMTINVSFGKLPFMPELAWAPKGGGGASNALYVFSIRGDFDMLVAGLLAALSLHRALLGQRPVLNFMLSGWSLAVIGFGPGSRAGLITVVVQLLLVFLMSSARRRRRAAEPTLAPGDTGKRGDPRIAIALILISLPMVFLAVRESPVVQDLSSVITPNAEHRFATHKGPGTARARSKSWSRLHSWIASNPGRYVIGVGFGPDFMEASGARRLLSVTDRSEVRSPHNYWLNTWARAGLVGMLLMAALWIAALRLAIALIRKVNLRDVDVVAILVVVSIPIAASFGVMLESPFGALPFAWAVGYLATRACQLGLARPFSLSG